MGTPFYKVRLREVKGHAQRHPVTIWPWTDANPSFPGDGATAGMGRVLCEPDEGHEAINPTVTQLCPALPYKLSSALSWL